MISGFTLIEFFLRWIMKIWNQRGSNTEQCSLDSLPNLEARKDWLLAFEADQKSLGRLDEKYHFLGGVLQWNYLRDIINTLHAASGNEKAHLAWLSLLESIYNDNSQNKPSCTGASDHYRRRRFHINEAVNGVVSWTVQKTDFPP